MGTEVQAKAAFTLSTVSNLTVTPDAGVTTANLLRLAVVYIHGSALTIASVQNQSASSLTFTEVGTGLFDAGNSVGLRYLVIQNAPAGITGVKVTLSASADFGTGILLTEYSGLSTTSAIDATGKTSQSQSGVVTTTDAVTSGSLTPTSQPGILDGVSINCNNATTPSAGTGFTSVAADILTFTGACSLRGEYKAISATSATAATFTNASTGGQTFLTFGTVLLDSGGGAVVASQGQDHRAQTFTFMGRR